MKFVQLFCAAGALAALGATAYAQSTAFALLPQNGSRETGTVTLQSQGSATVVTIALKGGPASAQPAHIHMGTCAKLNPSPKYPLKNVVGGKSKTVVNVPMSKLTSGGYAVNVHKSTSALGIYVACGDLSAASSSTGSGGTSAGGMSSGSTSSGAYGSSSGSMGSGSGSTGTSPGTSPGVATPSGAMASPGVLPAPGPSGANGTVPVPGIQPSGAPAAPASPR